MTKNLDLQTMTGNNGLSSWEPRELGLLRATLAAILLVGVITIFCVWISVTSGQKPVSQAVQVTLTELPPPASPPTPKAPLPSKPVPNVIPKPPPVPSHIAVATQPSVRHISKHMLHPVIRDAPSWERSSAPANKAPPPILAPVSAAPPVGAAPAAPTRGIQSYAAQMYTIIEANQNVPFILAQMGASGTAVIEIEVAPDGRVISARVDKSSGIPLIDATA
ncbi:MAG TPA: TonB family protein [Acidocella sp.]|uniref:energy transducer TonB family protein n=1 Tax=Acidocella sp. TaxID=50710 RepID=UPI002CF02194|nr:TonB family protein [Acidocella sp.]HVE20862.1 TonB family protein [Acidocella sp.]